MINPAISALAFGLLLLSGVAVLGIILTAGSNSSMRQRLETYVTVPETSQKRESRRRPLPISRFRFRMNGLLSVFVSEKLTMSLLSANWPITETEFVLIRIWLGLGGLALGWLATGSIFPGIGLAAIGLFVPGLLLRQRIHQRRLAFGAQMNDMLVLMTGAVRAGYSLPQSIDFIVREMASPTCEEFRRIQFEVSLGIPLTQALQNLSVRMQNDDLALLVAAISINAQVGGNLVTMIRSVAGTIRDRIRMFGEVRALTAQQRFSSYILTMMPFGLAAIMFILNPAFIGRLFEPGIYMCFPIGALIMTILGNLVIRKITQINV
jgi:tight adherence protein B